MALALLAVPHGGAKKIPRTTRVFIQLIKSDTPSGVVKSATETGPDKFFHFYMIYSEATTKTYLS